ncbi:acyltransferase domain-containing protein [Micromonospora rifamycinica]|uniref:acyltransferase domain-containing protein n=1 Tax=Micromonospora rifamycinica TaxID=291594 RepID=UPI0034375AE9
MIRREVDVSAVRQRLGLPVNVEGWLARSATPGEPTAGPVPPPPEQAYALLERLGVPEPDRLPAIEAMPTPDGTPELWWLLEHCHRELCRDLADLRPIAPWPSLPASLGPAGRYFYLHVFLTALPTTRRLHDSLGIPAEVSWHTLADLGAKMAIHRRTHGQGGLDRQNWLTRHFRGSLYRLGRLQFDRFRLDPAVAAGSPLAGQPVLDVHIPEDGPLALADCDESFASAAVFFARHFPQEPYPAAVCRSWLLDDQLAEYLPPTANIIRFQRRFRLFPPVLDGDHDVFEFVFRQHPTDLAELPQDTALQRAVVTHLRSGRHWRIRTGWTPL